MVSGKVQPVHGKTVSDNRRKEGTAMTKSARRLTIFTLTMAIFALMFAELVARNGSDSRRAYLGTNITCQHKASPACTYAL